MNNTTTTNNKKSYTTIWFYTSDDIYSDESGYCKECHNEIKVGDLVTYRFEESGREIHLDCKLKSENN